ncbi:MAG: hypothetical protein ACMG6E_07330 [Candidatus Roizmanbacteria bacterium]
MVLRGEVVIQDCVDVGQMDSPGVDVLLGNLWVGSVEVTAAAASCGQEDC